MCAFLYPGRVASQYASKNLIRARSRFCREGYSLLFPITTNQRLLMTTKLLGVSSDFSSSSCWALFCAITSRCLICLNDGAIKRSTEKTRMCLKPSVLPPLLLSAVWGVCSQWSVKERYLRLKKKTSLSRNDDASSKNTIVQLLIKEASLMFHLLATMSRA